MTIQITMKIRGGYITSPHYDSLNCITVAYQAWTLVYSYTSHIYFRPDLITTLWRLLGLLINCYVCRMPIQATQWTDYLNCPMCTREFAPPARCPVSLGCGHTLCRDCLRTVINKPCPFDQVSL